jgi:hypothetical protein
MRNPTLALTWYIWRPHRWSVTTIVGLILGFAVLQHTLPNGRCRDAVTVLSWALLVVGLAFAVPIFTMGHESDHVNRSPSYPQRLFSLPVRTSVLVFWPMLQGMLFVALLWALWANLALLPEGKEAPVLWPALMLAALLGWAQVSVWQPVASPILRTVITLAWLAIVLAVAAVIHRIIQGTPFPWFGQDVNGAMLAWVFGALIPASYGLAVDGVARARRGDRLEWSWLTHMMAQAAERLPRGRHPFSSPQHAQLWIECRRNATVLPLITAFLLAFLVVGAMAQRDLPWISLVTTLLALPVLALVGGLPGQRRFRGSTSAPQRIRRHPAAS